MHHGRSSILFPVLLLASLLMASTCTFAENSEEGLRRMGAHQCIDCINGGFLAGVRGGGHGRVKRNFPPGRSLCVAAYRYELGEQYVYFQLGSITANRDSAWTTENRRSSSGYNPDGERFFRIELDDGLWPDGGAWGVKAESWNAQCHRSPPE
jgi:hypothetical protein